MAFTIKPNRKNMGWIKRNAAKNAQKIMNAALNRWATEGGAVATNPKAKRKKKVFVHPEHQPKPPKPSENGAA
jgi:hypothetical protein